MMKAGVVYGKNDIRYEDIAKPTVADSEVLIKVKYSGICGSDIPRVNGNACHFYPMVLGHEFSGTIVEVGNKVKNLGAGDRVSGIPLVPCMECADCRRGDYSLCKNYSFIGSRRFGSFAEYVAVPAENAFLLDDNITFEQGALFEPSTVALHGILRTSFKPGKTVAVFGCGLIGLLTIQWARILGAEKIVAVNRSRAKLSPAIESGATHAISTLDDDYMQQLMDCTEGRGFDYVFEATGNEKALGDIFRAAANKSEVCLIGTPKNDVSFTVKEWEMLNRKEFNLTGSWMSYSDPFPGKEWDMTKEKFNSGELYFLDSYIDRVFGLSQIDKAFELYRTPGALKGKILIDSER